MTRAQLRNYNFDSGVCPQCGYTRLVKYEDCTVMFEFNPKTKEYEQQDLIFDDWMPPVKTYKCDNCEMEFQQ